MADGEGNPPGFKPDGGQVKFSEIADNFGGTKPHSLSEYYKGGRKILGNDAIFTVAVVGTALHETSGGGGNQQLPTGQQLNVVSFTPIRPGDEFPKNGINGGATGTVVTSTYPFGNEDKSGQSVGVLDAPSQYVTFDIFMGPFGGTEGEASSEFNVVRPQGIGENPSPNLPVKNSADVDGTPISISNFYDAYDSTTTQITNTDKSTSASTTAVTIFLTADEYTSWNTSKDTIKTTIFNTSKNTNTSFWE